MSEIKVQVRVGQCSIDNINVHIDLNETVLSLKKSICKIREYVDLNRMTIMYCGSILEDSQTLYTCELFSGAHVYVFQKIKCERKPKYVPVNDSTVGKLARGFRSLLLNAEYRSSLSRLCRPAGIHILLHNNPGLVEDPIALTLFQHPELLMKITDYETIKNLAQHHPALAAIILHVTSTAQKQLLLQNPDNGYLVGSELNPVNNPVNTSDEDDDLDDSNPSGQSNGHSYSTVVLGEIQREITAAQLASAIANATAQQSQPSTSGASTSTGSTGNALQNAQSPTTTELILPTQLQIMRDMGLTNEAVNIAALRISNDLETAINLVLSGFTNP